MDIDFSKLGQDDSANTALHPRKIFNALPSNQYEYPRDVQTEVWNFWHDVRDERKDIVIKMNTGSGKTIIGLLILKSCLNEGKGPAAYLCPDNYLAEQVRTEAEKLGISVTNDPRNPRFRGGDSILVTNIYKLVNGKSQFGVEKVDIPLESIVVDDVHACIKDTEQQFTLQIGDKAQEQLIETFKDDLHAQSPGALHDIINGDASRELLVPYWAWQREIDKVRDIISDQADEELLDMKWPLVNNVLEYANCFISGSTVEISLRTIPINIIRSFENASRRIFMSATISDDSVLVSHFDANVKDGDKALTPNTASDAGDRLILMPQYLTPEISDNEIREMADAYSKQVNVVVIVPSYYRAKLWADYADQTLSRENLSDGVERLKKNHVGLTILVNKYDGVDLPGEACEILIIDDLPDARRSIEKYDQMLLHGTGYDLTQPIQQIEQGMGRGVRSSKDYCAVILMGNKLTSQLASAGGISKFTTATQKQYELSQQLGKQLEDGGISAIVDALNQFLNRDPDWVKASKSNLSEVRYDALLNIREEIVSQRNAFTEALIGNYESALEIIRNASQSASDDLLSGLLMQEHAALKNLRDRQAAQAIQRNALKKNNYLLKPIAGTEYKRLSPTNKQAISSLKYLQASFTEARELPIEVNSLISDLHFGDVSYRNFEKAMHKIGLILGFDSQRPDSEFGTGPDNLWKSVDNPFFVIECKNEVEADEISKTYCNQISGHINWVEEHYGKEVDSVPIIVHPSSIVALEASPESNMRVINGDLLKGIRQSLKNFATAITENWEELDSDIVSKQLQEYGLNAGQIILRHSTDFKK